MGRNKPDRPARLNDLNRIGEGRGSLYDRVNRGGAKDGWMRCRVRYGGGLDYAAALGQVSLFRSLFIAATMLGLFSDRLVHRALRLAEAQGACTRSRQRADKKK